MDNHFKIIIPFYNVEKYVKLCVRSVMAQKYKNYQCILVNDISTDSSKEIIEKEIEGKENFILIDRKDKSYALKNIYDAIEHSNPSDEDIIVTLDGDDWLAHADVLSKLNEIYNEKKCWITYGSYMEYPTKIRGKFAKKIPNEIIEKNIFRESEWYSSHLRTFKHFLWKKIDKNDLLDSEGNFYRMAWDLSFMFPMLEMASLKSYYIKDIMYMYNVDNPLNDHKVDNSYQISLEKEIRNKPKYNPIEDYFDASSLLRFNRFDIAAKLIYAKNVINNLNNDFAEKLYLHHLNVWNGYKEADPKKENSKQFVEAFQSLLNSIAKNGFLADDESKKIPVINGLAINGSHRIASCIALNKKVLVKESDISRGQIECTSKYFLNKKDIVPTGLNSVYADEMALEFCRNKDNLYTISLFSSHDKDIDNLMHIIGSMTDIVYEKDAQLTEHGKLNYIHNLYYKEPWIGQEQQGYPGVVEKKNYCFNKGNSIKVILVEEDDRNKLDDLKEKIRNICGTGKHSVHINDTKEETWRIASSVFNSNSLHLINNRQWSPTDKFDSFFERYADLIKKRGDNEYFCVDSSAVLSAYGLRDCRDLDFLHVNNIGIISQDINCHNEEERHYNLSRHDIIHNPNNHMYFFGVKFASLNVVKDMKISRNEEKDKIDVGLINNLC